MENLTLIKPEKVQNIINKFCYTIGMIPTSYKMSLTYEEQIIAIGHYLETTVYPAINNNAEALAELQSLYIQLKDYVENYFENLDVQNEINNKLDTMAQDGTLAQIINEQVFQDLSSNIDTLNTILNINTIDELKNNENLKPNIYINVLGYKSRNDGFGSFYYIRETLAGDIETETSLLLKNNLTAIKLKNYGGTTSRKPFGIRNNAVVQNINNTGIDAQVIAADNENILATYENRDHVTSYKEFRTIAPNTYVITEVDETSVTVNSDLKDIFIGSIVDLYENTNFNLYQKYSGFVKDIQGRKIIVSHWYYTGNTEEGQIPQNVSIACIDMPTKVWVNNDNVLLTDDGNVQEGVIAEYGLFNWKYNENENTNARANGIDIINMNGKSDWGVLVRTNGDNEPSRMYCGFMARSTSIGYVARNINQFLESQDLNGATKFRVGKSGELLWQSMDGEYLAKTANGTLQVDGNGQISRKCYKIVGVTTPPGLEIDTSAGTLFFLLGSQSYTLKNGIALGQTIKLYSTAALNNIIRNGTPKALDAGKCCELVWDGNNWIDISGVLHG